MKFKKNWKRFWTLNRHHAEGFTLVELIVVIAILAILGGVAVPAYSGYVEKANKQADISLASEIKHALILAHYAGTLAPGTSVVVYYGEESVTVNEVAVEGYSATSGHDALVAVFGEGYAESLRLKYDGWTGNASNIDVNKINSSSFGEDNLGTMMEDVSVLSGVLAQYFGGGVTYNPLQNYMTENNISTSDPQVLANLAVLQAANSITNTDSQKFTDAYNTYTGNQLAEELQSDTYGNLDKMSAYAVAYAQMEGMLNYIGAEAARSGNTADIEKIAAIRENWATESAKLDGVDSVRNLLDATENQIGMDLADYAGAYYSGDAVGNDGIAFLSYMSSVNEVAPSIYGDMSALESEDFYKGSTVSNMINNYISTVEILNGYADSAVVVGYDGINVFCYPLDYK